MENIRIIFCTNFGAIGPMIRVSKQKTEMRTRGLNSSSLKTNIAAGE